MDMVVTNLEVHDGICKLWGYNMQSSTNGNKIGCSLTDDEGIYVLKDMSWPSIVTLHAVKYNNDPSLPKLLHEQIRI